MYGLTTCLCGVRDVLRSTASRISTRLPVRVGGCARVPGGFCCRLLHHALLLPLSCAAGGCRFSKTRLLPSGLVQPFFFLTRDAILSLCSSVPSR